MIVQVMTAWNRLPEPVKKWLKGAEVAVVTAVITGYTVAPNIDLSSKEAIAKFSAGIAASAYAAFRLYVTQQPISRVVEQLEVEEKRTTTITSTSTPTTLAEAPALPADHGQDG